MPAPKYVSIGLHSESCRYHYTRDPDDAIIRAYTENVGHPPVNLYYPGSVGHLQWTYRGAGDKLTTLQALTGARGLTTKRPKPARAPKREPATMPDFSPVSLLLDRIRQASLAAA